MGILISGNFMVKDGWKLMKINNAGSEPQLANMEMNERTLSCNKVSLIDYNTFWEVIHKIDNKAIHNS